MTSAATALRELEGRAWDAVRSVADPEIPSLSIVDLGMVRAVTERDGRVEVAITPTYSGCPATEMIVDDVRRALDEAGLADAAIRLALSPAWTSDWITGEGRAKLSAAGIAPPAGNAPVGGAAAVRFVSASPRCPRCGSAKVERLSAFGSTACKALYRCLACREPFDYFKPY
jgi:ring-1,2-phenylacetyl-CoA epoxidase subunit PaaD